MENNNKKLQPVMVKIKEEDKMMQAAKIEKGDLFISADYGQPKDKTYIVLYLGTDEEGKDIKSFEVITGRKEAYTFIKNMIECLDIHESKVLLDPASYTDKNNIVGYEESASIYEFMGHVSQYMEEDSFDIEDYNHGYTKMYDPEN